MTSDNKIFEEFPELKNIPAEKFPQHVHIIPDGNGRWAYKFHKIPIYGHRKGAEVLKKILRTLDCLPIQTISVWGFSADNWKRSKSETEGLMKLFESSVKEMQKDLVEKKMRFYHLGRKDRIPNSLRQILEETEEMTKQFTGKKFAVAIDFGGVDQEIRIMKKIQQLPKTTDVNAELLVNLRDANGEITPADLIIRTSGEKRTSDLGWLAQNAEFYSIEKLLPDSGTKDFIDAVIDFSKRERRFGGRLVHANTTV